MVPQVMFASMRAASPTTRTSSATMVPTKLASMRMVPANVQLALELHAAAEQQIVGRC